MGRGARLCGPDGALLTGSMCHAGARNLHNAPLLGGLLLWLPGRARPVGPHTANPSTPFDFSQGTCAHGGACICTVQA